LTDARAAAIMMMADTEMRDFGTTISLDGAEVGKAETLNFTCNVCGTMVNDCPIETIDREMSSCPRCGSTVRFRSIVHLLSLTLFGTSMPLPEFPIDKQIVGLGMSDWDGYARPLANKFSYSNTFLHCAPFYDVAIGDVTRSETCDFVISTEVFEHVLPPVSRAFSNTLTLLKPGGHFIFTVPWTTAPQTDEHFQSLHDYRIVNFDDEFVLLNRTRDGRYELHNQLVFHGGPGETLEMRVFCRSDLQQHFIRAGFADVHICAKDYPAFGIIQKKPWSLPIVARRPIVASPTSKPSRRWFSEQFEDADAARDQLRAERDDAVAALHAMRASSSWRITAPLRRASRAMRSVMSNPRVAGLVGSRGFRA
jgi:SAM-dependent methyltransferase